jgi:arsenite-transporting ATPase
MEESAIFDAVVDIVVEGRYDYYIYDLVPLGHALYYLSMAKVYDEWITKITKLREEMREYEEMVARIRRQQTEEDRILEELQYIRQRINMSSSILTDSRRTAFFFVLIPEELVILDTLKAAELFRRFDVPISGYVVNRVLPTELLGQNIPEYLRNRIEMQRRHLEEIRARFGDQVLAYVPELERDVTGLDMIARVAELLFGNGKA